MVCDMARLFGKHVINFRSANGLGWVSRAIQQKEYICQMAESLYLNGD